MRRLYSRRKHTPLCRVSVFRDSDQKPQTPRNPEVALLTNTLPCACYFFWHPNTPLANKNTVHIYIYLLHGNDTERTIEEITEDQSQHSGAQKDCLSAASRPQQLEDLVSVKILSLNP